MMFPTEARQVLSRRQKQLVELLSEGISNKEIAARMGIGEDSVKSTLWVIRQKFPELGSRYGAVRLAVRDHQRVQAILLSGWINRHGDRLAPDALLEIKAILSGAVAECLQ